jgi:hypothetical protein
MLIMAFAMTGMVSVQAQEANDTFIKIEDHDMFSQCFTTCDNNNDGIVTYAEAAAATMLSLEKGGRLNIIENYDFLKYFPNLEALSVGNTTQEIIDMHYQKNLKLVNVTNALWLKTIIVGGEVAPEITGVPANDPTRAAVNVMFYVEKPDVTFKFKDDGIKDFCLRNKVDVDKDGVISKEEAAAVTRLSLMNFKSFMRNIKSYDDLQYFPNLEYFHAGLNYLETIDLSCCPKLTEIDLSDSRMLKTIVLAKGCKPEIKYPVAYKGEKAKIVHKR